MMKLRLATPEKLVDIGRMKDLELYSRGSGARFTSARRRRIYDVESSPLVRGKCPLLAETAAHIGDVQVRNMGTIGGSIAHADPSADYPAALQALEARFVLKGAKSERTVSAADFFVDTFTTALEPGEIVREVIVPIEDGGRGHQLSENGAAGQRIRDRGHRGAHSQVRREDHDGAHRRHRLVERLLSRHRGRKGARRHSRFARRHSERRRAGRPRASTPTPICTPRPIIAAIWRAVYATRALGRRAGEVGLKIAGTPHAPVSAEKAYDLMQDPEVLARAIPGCESLDPIGPNEYRMKMKMALASISGSFDGKVRITDPVPPSSFRLEVDGAGKIGFVNGGGALTLAPSAEGTVVAFDGDVQVGGTIAAVGQRLIDTTARMMIKRFFDALAKAAGLAFDHFPYVEENPCRAGMAERAEKYRWSSAAVHRGTRRDEYNVLDLSFWERAGRRTPLRQRGVCEEHGGEIRTEVEARRRGERNSKISVELCGTDVDCPGKENCYESRQSVPVCPHADKNKE